ncbi:hypothetical protein [Caenimonas soli]|uniref:hypothetical protein n=1 Tax=Caenimonas soli TaxID=2735555 RepID=UPI001552CF47|nr:hypothetical protein [Caenimonas soli]NPC56333.1 hypothetical protein [Caenimonas soli]
MRSRVARWFVRGARLERAMANPQYRDGRFVNLEPETPTSLASLGDYMARQFSGDEVREPPAPLPVLAVDGVVGVGAVRDGCKCARTTSQ